MSPSAEPSGAAAQETSDQVRTRFDFYNLPRPVQDRFIASATGRGVPPVLLFTPSQHRLGLPWLVLLIAGLLGLAITAVLGFAQLESAYALQPTWFAALYALAAAAAGLGVMGFIWARREHLRYPYRPGCYLFPSGVVLALDERLQLYPITELQSVTKSGAGSVKLGFPSKSFVFPLPQGLDVDALKARLDESRANFQKAHAAHNRRELAALDPVRDSGFSNPLSSKDPLKKPADPRPVWFGVGAMVGVVIGLIVFGVRNKMGERALYAAAREADSAEAYRNYLQRGGERPEVRELLLPRAELKEAVGSLQAVERYIERHPDSKILPEIEAALHKELLAELERVKKKGTLAALEAFKKAHPQHAIIQKELQAARHQVFDRALERFMAATQASDQAREVFEKMLAHSDEHGPLVEVRFRRFVPKSAERADSSIRRSAYFMGTSALPSQYFTEEHAVPREKEATEQVIAYLQPLFPAEILKFVPGEHIEGQGDLPKVERPTLFISYSTEMSGGYTTQRPRGVYVGLGMMMRAAFKLPNGETALAFKDSSWIPPDVNEIWRDSLKPKQVYDRNARQGLERFIDKYLTTKLPLSENAEELLAKGRPKAESGAGRGSADTADVKNEESPKDKPAKGAAQPASE